MRINKDSEKCTYFYYEKHNWPKGRFCYKTIEFKLG